MGCDVHLKLNMCEQPCMIQIPSVHRRLTPQAQMALNTDRIENSYVEVVSE